MKPEQHPEDRALGELLGEWKVPSSLPPRFGDRVWQRIAAAEADGIGGAPDMTAEFWAWVAGFFARPALAVGYLMVLLVAGSALGFWQGTARAERASAELGAKYVQMIDPYQMPRH